MRRQDELDDICYDLGVDAILLHQPHDIVFCTGKMTWLGETLLLHVPQSSSVVLVPINELDDFLPANVEVRRYREIDVALEE